MDYFVLLAYASLADFNDYLPYFSFRRSILLLCTKKVISMNYGSSTSIWKPWRSDEEWRRDVYINSNLNLHPKSLAAAEALSLKSLETETIWSEFPNGWKAIVEQILASKEINKIKIAGLWVTIRDPVMKVNYLSEVIWDSKINLVYQFHQNRLASP